MKKYLLFLMFAAAGIVTATFFTSCGDDEDDFDKNASEYYTLSYSISNVEDSKVCIDEIHSLFTNTLKGVATVYDLNGTKASVKFETWDDVEVGVKLLGGIHEQINDILNPHVTDWSTVMVDISLFNSKQTIWAFGINTSMRK